MSFPNPGEPLFLFGVDADGGAEQGIGMSEEPGIGLAAAKPPIVDHVIESPYWMPRVSRPFGQMPADPKKQEKSELQEMMQMYAQWRKAA